MVDRSFPFRVRREAPRLRLICLPFAGGGASLFRTWASLVPADIEVCPMELPGRGLRFNEPLIADARELTASLRVALEPFLDVPIALFGHSMGARLAFELALSLGSHVAHLFVSAAPTPTWTVPQPIAHLTDAEFTSELRRLGGTPAEVLEEEELMALLLPVLRADFTLVERYTGAPGARVDCPVTVFAGLEDTEIPIEEARRWAGFTHGSFRMVEVSAGHFYLESARDLLLREMNRALAKLSAARALTG